MNKIVEAIFCEQYDVANELFNEQLQDRLQLVIENKINSVQLAELVTNNVRRMGRMKLIRIRVRKGKVQRRKKVSAVKGYTIRRGRLTRMAARERLRRRLGARRAKIKRRGKRSLILRKRKISMRKRVSLGVSKRMKWKR